MNREKNISRMQRNGKIAEWAMLLAVSMLLIFGPMVYRDPASATEFGEVNSTTTLLRQQNLTLNDFRVGVTSPTETTVGTSPAVPVFLFDRVEELLNTAIPRPVDLDVSVNSKLVLIIALSAIQNDGDTLDLTFNYVAVSQAQASNFAKADTVKTASLTVTTAGGLAVGDVYQFEVELEHGGGANPIDGTTSSIEIEFHLTNETGVGEFYLRSGCYLYEALY